THIDVAHGAFHLKPASLPRGPGYVAVKINGNFPDNRARNGLPTIQGAVLLADASNGRPLALLDSAEITLQRTGTATAVAARHLARADARTATICGCGAQAPLQLAALRHVLDVRRVFAWDIDPAAARAQAAVMGHLHHAVAAGAMRAEDVHAELGQVIAGTHPGRRDDDAIIVFDSSGTGIQDAAAAAVGYEVARQRGLGMRCSLT